MGERPTDRKRNKVQVQLAISERYLQPSWCDSFGIDEGVAATGFGVDPSVAFLVRRPRSIVLRFIRFRESGFPGCFPTVSCSAASDLRLLRRVDEADESLVGCWCFSSTLLERELASGLFAAVYIPRSASHCIAIGQVCPRASTFTRSVVARTNRHSHRPTIQQ